MTVAERVDYIRGLMEILEYERGTALTELAAVWGVAPSTVGNYSAEASRQVTADEDEAKRDITVGARKLFKAAIDTGNAKDAKMMGDLWAMVSGAKAPEKREHKVTGVSLDELDELRDSMKSNECLPTETDPSSSRMR